MVKLYSDWLLPKPKEPTTNARKPDEKDEFVMKMMEPVRDNEFMGWAGYIFDIKKVWRQNGS